MFKSFFIHYNLGPGRISRSHPRGFTAFISPNPEDTTGRTARLQIAFCNPKDQFVKRLGRDYAQAAEVRMVNKRDIPLALAAAFTTTIGYRPDDEFMVKYEESRYYYVLKYLI